MGRFQRPQAVNRTPLGTHELRERRTGPTGGQCQRAPKRQRPAVPIIRPDAAARTGGARCQGCTPVPHPDHRKIQVRMHESPFTQLNGVSRWPASLSPAKADALLHTPATDDGETARAPLKRVIVPFLQGFRLNDKPLFLRWARGASKTWMYCAPCNDAASMRLQRADDRPPVAKTTGSQPGLCGQIGSKRRGTQFPRSARFRGPAQMPAMQWHPRACA